VAPGHDAMGVSEPLACYRCGHSLASLTLPLARRDECPNCTVEVHVCRMCRQYDPSEPTGCSEDDALEVREKERANFCDYFKPSGNAFSPGRMEAQDQARTELAALFNESDPASPVAPPSAQEPTAGDESTEASAGDGAISRAEDLFRS